MTNLPDDVVELAAKAIEATTGYSGDIARKQARAALEAARYGEMREALSKLTKAADEDVFIAKAGVLDPLIDAARALLSTIGEPNPDSGASQP